MGAPRSLRAPQIKPQICGLEENDPASAATDPGHDPHHPTQEEVSDMAIVITEHASVATRPAISRRAFMRRGMAATAAVGIVAGGTVALKAMQVVDPDPCLAFVTAWNDALIENEAIARADGNDHRADKFWKANITPIHDRAASIGVPAATTAAGALAALRRVVDWDDSEPADLALIRAAMAFLEREAGA